MNWECLTLGMDHNCNKSQAGIAIERNRNIIIPITTNTIFTSLLLVTVLNTYFRLPHLLLEPNNFLPALVIPGFHIV